MKPTAGLTIAGFLLCLQGCAPAFQTQSAVTPSSYSASSESIPRTIGKLRKLVAIGVTQPPPKGCLGGGGEPVFDLDALGAAFVHFLTYGKGYEIVELGQEEPGSAGDASSRRAQLEGLVRAYAGKAEATAAQSVRNAVAELAGTHRADGILLVRSYQTCPMSSPVFRAILGFASLGVSEVFPHPDAVKPHPWIEASIIEAATGRIAWQKDRSLPLFRISDSTKSKSDAEVFFDDLESAIPKVLTR